MILLTNMNLEKLILNLSLLKSQYNKISPISPEAGMLILDAYDSSLSLLSDKGWIKEQKCTPAAIDAIKEYYSNFEPYVSFKLEEHKK